MAALTSPPDLRTTMYWLGMTRPFTRISGAMSRLEAPARGVVSSRLTSTNKIIANRAAILFMGLTSLLVVAVGNQPNRDTAQLQVGSWPRPPAASALAVPPFLRR